MLCKGILICEIISTLFNICLFTISWINTKNNTRGLFAHISVQFQLFPLDGLLEVELVGQQVKYFEGSYCKLPNFFPSSL